MAGRRTTSSVLSAEDRDGELQIAHEKWGGLLFDSVCEQLRVFLDRTGLRVSNGEIQLLEAALYVSSAGLLRLARMKRCAGIHSEVLEGVSNPTTGSWVVRASVYKSSRSKTCFIGLGDASPGNVGAKFQGSELRIAETRAVSRALRKAYGIGLCSVEELGAVRLSGPEAHNPTPPTDPEGRTLRAAVSSARAVASSPPQPSAVDRLKLVIREHQLPPAQVRQYGCQYLGVQEMRDATAVQINSLAGHLEQFAIASPTWLRSELDRAQTPPPLAESSSNTGKESVA
jgi:hypothetical protein